MNLYREYSLLHKLGVWLGGQSEGLTGFAVGLWGLLRKAALAIAPGGPEGQADKLVEAVFQLPEGVILIAVIATYLLLHKKRRVAKLKHLGLDLWSKCFGH